MVREDASPPGRGCAHLLPVIIARRSAALPAAPAPPRKADCKGIFDGKRGISWAFGFLSGDSRARGCHLLSLKAVPAKGTLATHGFMPVSKKQECQPDAVGFPVEVSLPSVFVFLMVV